ncbi:MAG: hypothetical protein UU70_C0010G0002 [Candidatus Yanofskybacteria bacterium GW2011_GWA1_41_6]|uniref:Uncharacterized protein n=1 Tax=Candidatus Yanofskybacteria bacterium GW2011_GWA1_41_6 TaxID=1619020 RepID=A0A0G0YVM8_9BACT|nr:MAG: hypothetical protein UU70_C0010G0002 [Candidatus Yanofskybacteria bacterium GW2011_GWA1_41_6]
MLKKLLYVVFALLALSFVGKAGNLLVRKANGGKMPVLVEKRFFDNDTEFHGFRITVENSSDQKVLTSNTRINFLADRFYWRIHNKNDVDINVLSVGDVVFLVSQLVAFTILFVTILILWLQKKLVLKQ